MSKLFCEFILATPKHDQRQFIAKVEMVQAPEVDELVNVNGSHFCVIERSWAISEISGDDDTYCYLYVAPFKKD